MDQQSPAQLDTGFLVSAPRRPPPKRLRKRLSALLADLEAVREAHLPDVLELGVDSTPRAVLILVVEPPAASRDVLETVRARLPEVLGRGETLAVRSLRPDHPQLASIRETQCVIGWRD